MFDHLPVEVVSREVPRAAPEVGPGALALALGVAAVGDHDVGRLVRCLLEDVRSTVPDQRVDVAASRDDPAAPPFHQSAEAVAHFEFFEQCQERSPHNRRSDIRVPCSTFCEQPRML